jgi:hypothetical protein
MVTMEGTGHCCNLEQPWLWDEHFLAFLRRHGLFDAQVQAPSPNLTG